MDSEITSVFPRMAEIVPEGEWGGARVYHARLDGDAARGASYVAGQYIPTPPGT
jgi:hypothetical protein